MVTVWARLGVEGVIFENQTNAERTERKRAGNTEGLLWRSAFTSFRKGSSISASALGRASKSLMRVFARNSLNVFDHLCFESLRVEQRGPQSARDECANELRRYSGEIPRKRNSDLGRR